MNVVVLIGRILFSLNFIFASLGHWSRESFDWATSLGVPMASILVPVGGIIAFLGGLSILLGYKARIGGWLIALYTLGVTVTMIGFVPPDVPEHMGNMIQGWILMKNLALLGGALVITYFGSGPLSIDNKHHVKRGRK